MNKKQQIKKLTSFIGLEAAHAILTIHTNKPHTEEHLKKEESLYGNMGADLATGNWNYQDIEIIKEQGISRCKEKLRKYPDITNITESEIEEKVASIIQRINIGP